MAQDINKVLSKMINEEDTYAIYKKGLLFYIYQDS